MRAGKLIDGVELTIEKVRVEEVKLVLVGKDAGKNTQKKVKDKCSFYQVPCLDCFDSVELSQAIGKNRMVVGILDNGFAQKIEELILS